MDEAANASAGVVQTGERPLDAAADLSVTPRDSLLGQAAPARPLLAAETRIRDSRPVDARPLESRPLETRQSDARAPAPRLRLVVNRQIRSGLISGKRFEVSARVESTQDLGALFKGYPDELVLAYKSVFSDKSHSLKRSELLKGCRLSPGSLNEIIELEERLSGAFDQLKRMVEILEAGDRDVVLEG